MLGSEKEEALRQLAEKRKQTRPAGYANLADYHCGLYECDYVSPWSKSAHNVDAEVMIVGHDWSSHEWMSGPIDQESAGRGYSSRFATNKNLFDLLDRHFRLQFEDVYATNAFPFVKRGRAQGSIRHRDMQNAVREFLLPQIKIIRPLLVVCLGKATFNAVRVACNEPPMANLADAIGSPFSTNPLIAAVAHTGARMHLRNRDAPDQVERDWEALYRRFKQLRRVRQQ